MNDIDKTVSVILPIYNVEKYLERAVESVSNQTYNNLEIILVDDGSTDSSGKICDDMSLRDNRIKVIHKQNGGISDARNVGKRVATGHYILFIDPDDFINEKMIEILVNNIQEYDADVSCCQYMNVYYNNSFPQYSDVRIKKLINREEFLKEYLYDTYITASVCTKLMKREISDKIDFPVGKVYEDAFYHLELVKTADRFICITKPLYYYYHRTNSITTKPYRKENMYAIEAYNNFLRYIEDTYEGELKRSLRKSALFRLIHANFGVFDKIIVEKEYKDIPEYLVVKKFLKSNVIKMIFDRNFSFSRMLGGFILLINENLYKKILLLDKQKKRIYN